MVSPTRSPPTGIKVLVVGAGIGGLTCAIECQNKGHEVIVLESFPKLEPLGDIISFGPNASRIVSRWGEGSVMQELLPIIMQSKETEVRRFDGQYITSMPSYGLKFGSLALNGHRGEMHQIFFEFARSQGLDIRLNTRVASYWESPTSAGVLLTSGERLSADIVVAADGVRSRARELILGYVDKPLSSGYAVWRTWFTTEELAKDPRTKSFAEGDRHVVWIGPEVHFVAGSLKGGKDLSWVCTHRDQADIEESYSFPGKLDEVLEVVKGWDETVRAIVEKTPSCVDWKLVYREPLPTWVSKGGRAILLGDAAHPFLPTSIQGASQAMEDGVVLACTLASAGKEEVPLAARAYERIRYERCRRAQQMGEENRDKWHKADFDEIMRDTESMKLPTPDWLFAHDTEAHALAVFPDVAQGLREGRWGGEDIGYQTGILKREKGGVGKEELGEEVRAEGPKEVVASA